MNRALKDALARALGTAIARARPLSGGDINDAYDLALEDGRRVFVKAHSAAPAEMFAREADGLRWLAEARGLRVPDVLAVGSSGEAPFLALEFIAPGRPRADHDEVLGRGLAALHHTGAGEFGWRSDNFIGTLEQPNRPTETWTEFYAERRLRPMVERAVRQGAAPSSWIAAFERLFDKLGDLVGPAETPSRLHGDLWSGNLHVDSQGNPCLIDPAVYGGHREIDLAMLELFGTVSRRVLAAYSEIYPLAPGRDERVALYQLYPLLVHVNLFGGSYVAAVEAALNRYR
ncbi:MAG: fructosamine kinase family protein [Proteobacteria bacterium]|nr:fructosamine kinase family protein [Pseudomonadota bacterium]